MQEVRGKVKYDQCQPYFRGLSGTIFQMAGKFGCYLLSLMQLAQTELDEKTLADLYKAFNRKGWIDKECTILTPESGPAILRYLTGDKWTLRKAEGEALPVMTCGPGTEIIYKYHAFSGAGYHYKTLLVDTETPRERKLCGYRIYTRIYKEE
jgi:hypothetical protein